MSYFTDADIEAAVKAEEVHLAELFKVDFASGAKYYSTEVVGFTDGNGIDWEGMGNVVTWSDLTLPKSGIGASKRTYTFSMEDSHVADLFLDTDVSDYRGKTAAQFFQVFDHNSNPIGLPVHLVTHIMDKMYCAWTPDGKAEISVDCEGIFATRNSPANGDVTAADQKRRSPTDKGLNRQYLASNDVAVTWPDF